jgi:hypothetical protein
MTIFGLGHQEDHQEPRSYVSTPRRTHPNSGTSPQNGTTPGPWAEDMQEQLDTFATDQARGVKAPALANNRNKADLLQRTLEAGVMTRRSKTLQGTLRECRWGR